MKTKMRFTPRAVELLKPVPGKQRRIQDEVTPCLYLVIGQRTKSWRALSWVNGRQRWKTLGTFPELGVQQARKLAEQFYADPAADLSAKESGSFDEVAGEFVKRHVDKVGLRSKRDVMRYLGYIGSYWSKRWGKKKFEELRRGDVNQLLDWLEDHHSPAVADKTLATLSKLCSWYQTRSNYFTSPVVRGMKRGPVVKRDRILSDEELAALWRLDGQYADFLKVSLLTGQRQAKIVGMRWTDIDDTGTWTIPSQAREKINAHVLPLTPLALSIIRRQPRVAGYPYVFAGRGGTALSGFNKRNARIREQLRDVPRPKGRDGEDAGQWRPHDLRRTARSLMSRAGVTSHTAERALGHTVKGVEAVYDPHGYVEEKGEALVALAQLVSDIVRGPNVHDLPIAPLHGVA